jgi:tRNA-dihydrouridine synthase A
VIDNIRNYNKLSDFRFSIAPMMDWTDRHCRFFHRLLSHKARLYTEMVTAAAILHGPRDKLLGFSPQEKPLALQLGGSDPRMLEMAARIARDYDYDEINLNVGCPSDRVQGGYFGACLMREPQRVGECLAAMREGFSGLVTVKCRIGVDDQEPREALYTLAQESVKAGTGALIVHARKAWLKGLSPKENRDIPPLDYPLVYALKQDFSEVPVILNGGIVTLEATKEHLAYVDGVMLGRAAYHHPDCLLQVDPLLFGRTASFGSMHQALAALEPYIDSHLQQGGVLKTITRHLLGCFGGRMGARAFRRHLAVEAVRPGAGIDVLRKALSFVSQDETPRLVVG